MKHKAAHPLLRLSFGPYSPSCVEGVFCELRAGAEFSEVPLGVFSEGRSAIRIHKVRYLVYKLALSIKHPLKAEAHSYRAGFGVFLPPLMVFARPRP